MFNFNSIRPDYGALLFRLLISTVILIAIFYFGFIGIIIGFVFCAILRYFSILKSKYNINKLSFLLKSQVLVGLVVYLILIPFDSNLLHFNGLQTLANWQLHKFPEAKAYIAAYSDGEFFPNYYEWLHSRSFLSRMLFSWYGALYASFVCVSFWFALVLPLAFELQWRKREANAILVIVISCLVVFSGVLSLQLDALYLSSTRVDLFTPLALPTMAYGIILLGSTLFGMCFRKRESNVEEN